MARNYNGVQINRTPTICEQAGADDARFFLESRSLDDGFAIHKVERVLLDSRLDGEDEIILEL